MSEIENVHNGVTWFLFNNRNCASTRLQGYLIHDELEARGRQSEVFWAPPFPTPDLPVSDDNLGVLADLVRTPIAVFQRVRGPRTNKLITLLQERNIATIYVECDYRPFNNTPILCDWIVVTSSFLYDYFENKGGNCIMIPDPIESKIKKKYILKKYRENDNEKIRLAWVGHSSNWHTLQDLRSLLVDSAFDHYQLITISDHPEATVKWELKTVADHVLSCDIGVIPTGKGPAYKAKSQNRVTLFMALGIPVVAGCIPAYREIIDHGVNGFLVESDDEWKQALQLLNNRNIRFKFACNAYENVVPNYLLDTIVDRWIALFDSINFEKKEKSHSVHEGKLSKYERVIKIDVNINFSKSSILKGRWLRGIIHFLAASLLVISTPQAFKLYRAYIRKGCNKLIESIKCVFFSLA